MSRTAGTPQLTRSDPASAAQGHPPAELPGTPCCRPATSGSEAKSVQSNPSHTRPHLRSRGGRPKLSYLYYTGLTGFPDGSVVKNPPAMQEMQETSVHSWAGKSHWRRAWQPNPVSSPGESHGQGSLVGYTLVGCQESDMMKVTEHVRMHRGVTSTERGLAPHIVTSSCLNRRGPGSSL